MITSTKAEPIPQVYQVVSYGLGLIATGMAVSQMVTFEEFIDALAHYGVVGEAGSIALAITLIALEVFSVPFLFRLALSPLARMVSALFVVLLPCVWTVLTIGALARNATVPNAGYVGGFLEIPVGLVALTLTIGWLSIVGFSFGPLGGHKALKPKI